MVSPVRLEGLVPERPVLIVDAVMVGEMDVEERIRKAVVILGHEAQATNDIEP